MNATIEALYQRIGQEALAAANDCAGKLMVYAEVQDGVVAADMVYSRASSDSLRFRFCRSPIKDTVYALWQRWREQPGNTAWWGMSFVMDNGRFKIHFTYPDQIDENQDVGDRRSVAIRQYFGDSEVDYSAP